MISLGRLISNTPIPIYGDLKFYQLKIRDMLDMGENMYWSLLKVWDLDRKDMLASFNIDMGQYTDFELWSLLLKASDDFKIQVINSTDCFLHTKIEFLSASNTIVIGENNTQTVLTEKIYYLIKEIVHSISNLGDNKENEQYQENEHMSEREKELIRKMKNSAAKLDKIKNGERSIEDRLAKQVLSLVAIGHYTFDEVYDMTIIQVNNLLKKYVEIQQYELYTTLSPYMDSKKNQSPKHWLES